MPASQALLPCTARPAPSPPPFRLFAGRGLLEDAQTTGLDPQGEHWTGGGGAAGRGVAAAHNCKRASLSPRPAAVPTVTLPADALDGDATTEPSPLLDTPLAEHTWEDAGAPPVDAPGSVGPMTVQPRIINGQASCACNALGGCSCEGLHVPGCLPQPGREIEAESQLTASWVGPPARAVNQWASHLLLPLPPGGHPGQVSLRQPGPVEPG